MDLNDLDYGVMGAFLIPNSNYFLTGAKNGNLYLLNKDNMGGYSSLGNQVVQVVPLNVSLHCQPAYYKGASNEYVYIWSENDQLRSLKFNRNSASLSAGQVLPSTSGPVNDIGAFLSVSSNGTTPGTGILWAYYFSTAAGNQTILAAFDANDITKELWNSAQNSNDNPGNFAKFSTLTIANGHVFVPTLSKMVSVYGLK